MQAKISQQEVKSLAISAAAVARAALSDSALFPETIQQPLRIPVISENLGGPYTFTGFHLVGRCGSYYIPEDMSQCMAIPGRRTNKAGAWAYIRSQLTKYAQLRCTMSLPVNYTALLSLARSEHNHGAKQIKRFCRKSP